MLRYCHIGTLPHIKKLRSLIQHKLCFFFNHNFGTSFYDCDLCCPDRRRVTANTLISFKSLSISTKKKASKVSLKKNKSTVVYSQKTKTKTSL